MQINLQNISKYLHFSVNCRNFSLFILYFGKIFSLHLQMSDFFRNFATKIENGMNRAEVVKQISQTIRQVAPQATAILYGSQARGEARPDSDIDVLILLDGDKMNLQREMEVTGPLNEIEWKTGVLVSPTVMLRRQWENMPFKTPFYVNVMNEGIRI